MSTYLYAIYNYFFPTPVLGLKKILTIEAGSGPGPGPEPLLESYTKQQIEDDLIDELLVEVTTSKLTNFYAQYDKLMEEIIEKNKPKPIITLKPLPQIEWYFPLQIPASIPMAVVPEKEFTAIVESPIHCECVVDSELDFDTDWEIDSVSVSDSESISDSDSDSESEIMSDCVSSCDDDTTV